MKNHTILGIDPGLANTGLGVVKTNATGYTLISTETVKTKAQDETGKRLAIIHDEINDILDTWSITAIAIERVFHNKNISSSMTTGAVVGLAHLIAHQRDVPIDLFTPQQIKKASGLGSNASKEQVLKMTNRFFSIPLKSYHEADASLCALASILKRRAAQ